MTEIPDDAVRAFLFRNPEAKLYAISLRADGTNLPLESGHWLFETEIELGVREPLPVDIDPEPAIRGVRANGYFVWRAERILPFGTGQ